MRQTLARIGALLERRIGLVILVLAVGIPLLLLLFGVGLPPSQPTRVIISELSAKAGAPGESWVELYNDTDETLNLQGWQIRTLSETVTLQDNARIQPGSYLLVPAFPEAFAEAHPALSIKAAQHDGELHIAQAKGAIYLIGPIPERDNQTGVIDSVGWPPATVASAAKDNKITDIETGVNWPPTAQSLVRRTQGLDTNDAGDWRPGPPSPASFTLPTMRMGNRVLVLEIINYASLIGGNLLWAAFVLMGLIARRFQTLTGQRTFWQAMVIAPVGILIYNLIQTNAFFARGNMTDCKLPTDPTKWTFKPAECEQLFSFVPLFIAAAVMAYVVYLFYRISRRILEV